MNVNCSIDTSLTIGHYVFEASFWLKDWKLSTETHMSSAIKVILINHGHYPVHIQKGDRIAQLVFCSAYRRPELVKDEDRTGGLGSTGTGEPLSGLD